MFFLFQIERQRRIGVVKASGSGANSIVLVGQVGVPIVVVVKRESPCRVVPQSIVSRGSEVVSKGI